MTRHSIVVVLSFFLFLFFQVLVLQHVVLFNTAFCLLYISFLLLLPVETNRLLLLLVGFLMGFGVDLFYESLGLHMFACVFVMYVRNTWLNSITPQGGYDANAIPALSLGGLQWFLVYITPLVFLHHILLFFMEAGGFGYFWFTTLKVVTSSLFTILVIVMVQYLFPHRVRT